MTGTGPPSVSLAASRFKLGGKLAKKGGAELGHSAPVALSIGPRYLWHASTGTWIKTRARWLQLVALLRLEQGQEALRFWCAPIILAWRLSPAWPGRRPLLALFLAFALVLDRRTQVDRIEV